MAEAQHDTTGEMGAEDRSKDEFFVKLADLAENMISAHGKEFAMGVLIIAARFIAEGKPLVGAPSQHGNCGGDATFAMTGGAAVFQVALTD